MNILILAAGYATRLYPLTLNKPKPLLMVGKKLIIEHIFDKIAGLKDVNACYIITNQKFFNKFRSWAGDFSASGGKFKFPVEVIDDETTSNENRLGAIKDIEFAIKKRNIKDDILVIGGDNLFEFDLGRFADFSTANKPGSSLALFDIKSVNKARLYGVTTIDASCRLIDFKEKPQDPASTLIATCVYYFPKEKTPLISDYLSSDHKSDAPGNYIKWLSETDEVYGFVFKESWYDIGDIESYEEADKRYGEKKA